MLWYNIHDNLPDIEHKITVPDRCKTETFLSTFITPTNGTLAHGTFMEYLHAPS